MELVNMVESQLIASIKNQKDLDKAIKSSANIAFLLTGDISTAEDYIKQLREAGMFIFLHLDFIEGLSNTKSAIKYIADVWKPTGIISTKINMIRYAKEEGLITIQRIFLIDRAAVDKGIEMVKSCKPDAVEVLPGLMPKVVDKLSHQLKLPLIVGGLIQEKEDILLALEAGALAVSSGDPAMWDFDL
ncbi:glycerol-3-phosphate responsive antiterminator [Fictibacillus phosphorivorans]|uniref:glycerol-3-phosphate responsive antiterminator n=1 Tax=Fictibacillus phosphorivorans TaxID=1221500 RepID=UPI00203A50FA|nr:glycerol-3-phosphate responsive antiterminator [Fictibacillus phosphorivorans]MCM3717683.1 glycerol-3-phosphate responsive antiterminator [Fictibacillus phosphorivorans]MCM3775583.1 glycerol-3-phosphate responsive antiterminator [Fictibacillus phosphorivorans]